MLIACMPSAWFESLFTLNISLNLRWFACFIMSMEFIGLFIFPCQCSRCILVGTIVLSLYNHVGMS